VQFSKTFNLAAASALFASVSCLCFVATAPAAPNIAPRAVTIAATATPAAEAAAAETNGMNVDANATADNIAAEAAAAM
jgi:hypothetical protein